MPSANEWISPRSEGLAKRYNDVLTLAATTSLDIPLSARDLSCAASNSTHVLSPEWANPETQEADLRLPEAQERERCEHCWVWDAFM